MALQFEQHQSEGVTILRFRKFLRGDEDAAYLLVILDQLLGSEKKQILLNFKELTEVDEAGVNALTEAHAKAKAANGVIKMVNPAQRHTDWFILSQVAPLFPSFNDEEEALRSFMNELGQFDILEFVREMNNEEQQHLGADGNAEKQGAPDGPATGQK